MKVNGEPARADSTPSGPMVKTLTVVEVVEPFAANSKLDAQLISTDTAAGPAGKGEPVTSVSVPSEAILNIATPVPGKVTAKNFPSGDTSMPTGGPPATTGRPATTVGAPFASTSKAAMNMPVAPTQ